MRTRYGVSPWIHQFPDARRPDFPKLKGEAEAPVVIIGGGLTGCAIAYACAAAGVRAIVLEAARIGQGSAGRGQGLVLPDPVADFRELAGVAGMRAARAAFQAWRSAGRDGVSLLKRLGIKAGHAPVDVVTVADLSTEKALRREFEARVAAGLEATLVAGRPLARVTAQAGAVAGIRSADAFTLDPYRAAIGLALAARKGGAQFYERTPVRKVKTGKIGVELVLDGGTVRAATVVVATGAPTAEYKPLRRHFKARDRYIVLTEPMPATVQRQVGPRLAVLSDTRDPAHHIRWTPDNRILIAGADQDTPAARLRESVLVQRTGQLMYELLLMYPAIAGLRPEYGWDASYGRTADGLPYIGAHRNYPHHLFALGGGAVSSNGAFLAARIVLRALRGEPEKADAVFGWAR